MDLAALDLYQPFFHQLPQGTVDEIRHGTKARGHFSLRGPTTASDSLILRLFQQKCAQRTCILTVFITAVLVWVNSRYALAAAIGTFSARALVMIILQTACRSVVAPDSIMAMTIRMVVWGIILVLMYFQRSKRMSTVISI